MHNRCQQTSVTALKSQIEIFKKFHPQDRWEFRQHSGNYQPATETNQPVRYCLHNRLPRLLLKL